MAPSIGDNQKMPTFILLLFSIIQLCFCCECGFTNYFKAKYRSLLKFFSLTLTAVMIILASLRFSSYGTGALLYSLYFIEYIGYLLVLFTSNYNVYKFLCDLFRINMPIPLKQLNAYGLVSMVYLFTVTFVHALVTQINCSYFISTCYTLHVPTIITYIPSFAIETIPIVQGIVLQCVYVYIENIKPILKAERDDIKKIQTLYGEIADCYDKISPMLNKLTLISLLINIPKLMILVWQMLHFILIDYEIPKIVLYSSLSLFIVVNMSITAVVTEMIQNQVKCVRKLLIEGIIKSSVIKKLDISNCMLYMEERSIADKAWDVIPLGIDLAYCALSFCVSYLIVIIQLTHVYE